jgi:hypothetical protein
MSKTSKSPRKVAQAAYRVAQNTLPEFSHQFSPKKFTQSQLFVCLVLKIFFKTDYRGIVELLKDMIKRNQGESLRSKTYWAQNREMMLKVLTHNIGIILLLRELFYRAYLTPLIL